MRRAWDWFVIVSSPLVAFGLWGTENVGFLRFSAALLMARILLDAVEGRYKTRIANRAASTRPGSEG